MATASTTRRDTRRPSLRTSLSKRFSAVVAVAAEAVAVAATIGAAVAAAAVPGPFVSASLRHHCRGEAAAVAIAGTKVDAQGGGGGEEPGVSVATARVVSGTVAVAITTRERRGVNTADFPAVRPALQALSLAPAPPGKGGGLHEKRR